MKDIALILVASVLVSCAEFNLDHNDERNTFIDAEISTENGKADISLTEGSTILFTDDYLIIKSTDGETKVPLGEISSIKYK